VTTTQPALRRWFLGGDDYWRAFGIDVPIPDGNTVTPSTISPRFTANITGRTVTVNATASTASASTITGYGWDFGDGATATGVTASHTYPTAGEYSIVLTVTDDRDESASTATQVAISAPVAAFTWTAAAFTASFDASTSVDTYATITGWRWDFGDGATGTGVTVSHAYATAGTHTVTLTVTDAAGSSDTEVQTVTVALPVSNPVAAFTTLTSGQTVSFDASSSSTTNATITRYNWTFGDGTPAGVPGVTVSHTYPVGTWNPSLTITDSQGRSSTVSHPVTVTAPVNQPPTAAFTASTSALTASFSAVTSSDGDGSIAAYAWTYGDGGTGTGLNPTHRYSVAGTFSVRLTVTDNLGATGTTTKSVTVTAAPLTDYITSSTATPSSTLHPASTAAVLQQFLRSPNTGEFYSSQMHPEPDGITESVRLSRMTVSGTLLDQMLLTGAGHGTTFALEYSGGQTYIWLNWQRTVVGGPTVDDVVRFPYKAGTFTRSQVTGITTKVAGPTYRLPAFDWLNGYAVIRTPSGSTAATYSRYKLTDVLAGNLTAPVNTITLPEAPIGTGTATLQGFATYAGAFFRYTGAPSDADRTGNPPQVTEYDWATGGKVRSIDTTAFGGTTSRSEPEGLSVYDNGTNPVLFFGVSLGPVGGPHTYPTWWYPLTDTTSNPPPPAGGAGDSGINQTGVAGRQQTGTGVRDYGTLTGTSVGAKINAAGAGNIASLPAGTFTLTNFTQAWGGTANGSQAIAGAAINAGIKGVYGAGSKSTIITLPTGATPPALESGATTNQHYLMAFKNPVTSGFVLDGLTIQGVTGKTNDFGGIWTQGSTNMTISNCTIKGVVGSAGAPPGETFVFNVYSQASGTINFQHVTFEGSGLGAAGLGTNSTSGTINIDNCVASNFLYSAGVATWENRGTINVRNLKMGKNRRNFGAETNAGTINIYNPIWGDPVVGNDFNITWTNNYHDGVINVYFTTATDWQNFIGPRTNKKIKVVTNTKQVYGGSAGGAYTGTGDIWNNFRVYVAGVRQTTTNYVAFTGNHVA
jgi:PKD repeat protein